VRKRTWARSGESRAPAAGMRLRIIAIQRSTRSPRPSAPASKQGAAIRRRCRNGNKLFAPAVFRIERDKRGNRELRRRCGQEGQARFVEPTPSTGVVGLRSQHRGEPCPKISTRARAMHATPCSVFRRRRCRATGNSIVCSLSATVREPLLRGEMAQSTRSALSTSWLPLERSD